MKKNLFIPLTLLIVALAFPYTHVAVMMMETPILLLLVQER